jgi:LPXTG-motif cell wall-anchored protein
MKKKISLAAFLLATLAWANAAGAQTSGGTSTPTTTGDPKEVMMIGTIVSAANPDYLIIKVASGNQKFKFKDKAMRPADLKPGTQVTMWVDEDDADDNPPGEKPESETYTVYRMTVADAAPPPAPATTPTPAPAASAPPPAEPAQPAPTTPAPAARAELPDTASPLTAFAILGLLALIGAVGVRRRRHSM